MFKYSLIIMLLLTACLFADRSSLGSVGLGIIIGNPSGIHAKFRLSGRNDIDAMVGLDWDDWFFTHCDYLWNFSLASGDADLGFYVGPGAFIASNTKSSHEKDNKGTLFGPQGVAGLRIILGKRFDIFGEAQIRMNIIDGTDVNAYGGLGAHVYF